MAVAPLSTVNFQDIEADGVTSFLRDVPVTVQIPNKKEKYYVINVKHGEFTWMIYKTNHDLMHFHSSIHSYWNNMYTPRYRHSRRNKLRKELLRIKFPKQHTCEAFESYLNEIMANEAHRRYDHINEFFQISKLSFVIELGVKGMEGKIKLVKSDFSSGCWQYLTLGKSNKRWCVLKDTFILLLDSRKRHICEVLLFDESFDICFDENDPLNITIQNQSYTLSCECNSKDDAKRWKYFSDNLRTTNAWNLMTRNTYDCFSPQRQCMAHWFVNGESYFSAVADAMEIAKEEIYFTDWVISPGSFSSEQRYKDGKLLQPTPAIHLKRGEGEDRKYWQLDELLKRKALQGVRIYVMIYKEVPNTMKNYSDEAEEYLRSLHPNIQTLRHPDIKVKSILWSHHEKLVIVDQTVAFIGGIDLAYNRFDCHNHHLSDDINNNGSTPRWIGRDYNNLYQKDRMNYDEATIDDESYRKTYARTPWHDIASVTYGEAARDVSRHFIERWNFNKLDKDKDRVSFLFPKSYHDYTFNMANYPMVTGSVTANVQILRSSGKWSTGHEHTETSIHNAYISAIENSEKYVYIENQYFISVKNKSFNKIVETIYRRILKAEQRREQFRVYIVIPLLPSAENDIRSDKTSQTIQTILGIQFRTLNRGANSTNQNTSLASLTSASGSLIGDLEEIMGNKWKNYISVCGLRTHGKINDKHVTELIYVHSKMLIVDDKIAIIGSANINDRSMEGDRDSEVAMLVQDTEMIPSTMGGQSYNVGKFASSLRKRSFAEHLGCLPEGFVEGSEFEPTENIDDVTADEFYHNKWKNVAQTNKEIFEKVFRCLPSDEITSFDQKELEKFENKKLTDPRLIEEELQKVKGHLVAYPLDAFKDTILAPDLLTKESLLPGEAWE